VNRITSLKTVDIGGDQGPTWAIMVAADISEPSTLGEFVPFLVEQVKLQRMAAPPETSHLLVTVIGDVSAEAVASAWREYVASDPIMSVFMSRMAVADVLHGTAAGKVLGQVSLVGAE